MTSRRSRDIIQVILERVDYGITDDGACGGEDSYVDGIEDNGWSDICDNENDWMDGNIRSNAFENEDNEI